MLKFNGFDDKPEGPKARPKRLDFHSTKEKVQKVRTDPFTFMG